MSARRWPMSTPPDLVILDFDGVVVDSELLSNTLLADFVTQEGFPATVEHAIQHYMGRRWEDCALAITRDLGRALPDDFQERYRTFENGRMRRDVQAIAGVAAFLAANRQHRFCVASSSNIGWLDHGTDKFALRPHLGTNLFSATEVARGKPAPDIFLLAATRMAVVPGRCVVIEDSVSGVQAAVAAGMTAIGFLGGSHIRDGHSANLLNAGAHATARDYGEVAELIAFQPPAASAD